MEPPTQHGGEDIQQTVGEGSTPGRNTLAPPFQEIPITAVECDDPDTQHEFRRKLKTMDELFNAAISGNVSFFEEPTGKDFNLEQVTERGNSILHLAAKSGKVQFMKKVLDLQRSLLLLTNCNDDTALHIAARLGHLDMTELLITCAKDLEAEKKFSLLRTRNSEENTALHEAIRNNYYDIVELLVREDPELVRLGHENEEIQTDRRTKARKDRESPLFLAVDQGFFRIAHHIIDTVQKCSYGGRNNMNVLHAAVLRYQTSFVEERLLFPICKDFLLRLYKHKCRQINYRTDFLRKILFKFPEAILEADKYGWTPLHYAAYYGNTEVVKLFLENNISLAYKIDKEGMSALHISAMRGHGGAMRALITKCPNTCELLDNKGRTALHLAVEHGKINTVKILLQTLAFQDHINEKDKEGNTPLHVAAINERFRISMMLTDDRRVEKLAENKEGMSAADIIESRKKLSWSEKKAFMSNWLRRVDQPTKSLERVVGSHIQATEKEHLVSKMCEDKNTKEPTFFQISNSVSDFQITAMTIITTVTFAAALQLPGGYDNNGKAILKDNKHFKSFLKYDSLAFGTSAAAMCIHFCTASLTKNHSIVLAKAILSSFLIDIAVVFMVFAFPAGISAVLDENSTISGWVPISFLISLFLFLSFVVFRMGFPSFLRVRKLLGYM